MSGKAIKQLTPEEIAISAYLIWENEGCPQHRDADNWLQAEQQLQVECLAEDSAAANPSASKSTRQSKAARRPVKQLQEVGS